MLESEFVHRAAETVHRQTGHTRRAAVPKRLVPLAVVPAGTTAVGGPQKMIFASNTKDRLLGRALGIIIGLGREEGRGCLFEVLCHLGAPLVHLPRHIPIDDAPELEEAECRLLDLGHADLSAGEMDRIMLILLERHTVAGVD